jgi:type II secretion system protein N
VGRPSLRVLGIALAALSLVVLFIYIGFPYEALGDFAGRKLRNERGIDLQFASAGPHLSAAGPGIELTGVRAELEDGKILRLDRARLRPAWSLSWFQGEPSIYTEFESGGGQLSGAFRIGDAVGFTGELRHVEVAELPFADNWPGASLEGVLDARVEVSVVDGALDGIVDFDARDGAIALPGVPMAIPFSELTGHLALGGDEILTIREMQIHGPLIEGTISGTVGRPSRGGDPPLQIEVQLQVKTALARPLGRAGLRVEPDGRIDVHISGTLSEPTVR